VCGRESGPLHLAGNWLTVCDDCKSNNQTAERTERPLPNLPNATAGADHGSALTRVGGGSGQGAQTDCGVPRDEDCHGLLP
jgi:hypothetical protein